MGDSNYSFAPYVYSHRVRYRECDPMGVVYHAHYVDYFEAARTEALRSHGMTYRELEESGVIMPVVDVQVRYHRPARYDDLLDIETRMTLSDSHLRVRFHYDVTRRDETTRLVSGTVNLCFMDADRWRPIPAPERLLELIPTHHD